MTQIPYGPPVATIVLYIQFQIIPQNNTRQKSTGQDLEEDLNSFIGKIVCMQSRSMEAIF